MKFSFSDITATIHAIEYRSEEECRFIAIVADTGGTAGLLF